MLYFHTQLINKDSLLIFNENFELVSSNYSNNNRSARNGLLFVPSYESGKLRKKSIPHSKTFEILSKTS